MLHLPRIAQNCMLPLFYSNSAVLLHSRRSVPKICTVPFLRYFSAENGDSIQRESMDYDVVIVGVVFGFLLLF